MTTTLTPPQLPSARILGPVTPARRQLLSCIDVVVGYVVARYRFELAGWRLEAALVDSRSDFRGGETVALRAMPMDGASPADLPPIANGILREIGSRVTAGLEGIANVVPDVACVAPDVDGLFAVIDEDWDDERAATA